MLPQVSEPPSAARTPPVRAAGPAQIVDLHGNPIRHQASFGRHVRRAGASTQAQLANWINQVVGARVAEREKRLVSERALDLYTNSAIAKGVLDGVVTEVVGTGLTPLAAPMLELLGRDEAWAEAYTGAAEALTEVWGFDPRKFCDATRRMHFYQLQALAEFTWRLDGIALFQVRLITRRHAPSRLALLPVDPSRLATPYDKQSAEIYDGVEVDRVGMPVAVHIRRPEPAGAPRRLAGDTQRVAVWHEETGLPQMLLVGDVRNVAEYRQDSLLSAVIPEIKTSDDLVEAALIRTMLLNMFAIYVSQEVPGVGLGGEASLTPTGSVDWSTRVYELAKGMVLEGPPGSKPESIDSDAPGPGFSDMWRSVMSRVGMATQRGSENILREYNSSYSASMASVENAERFAELDRMVLNSTFNQPVMSWLLYDAYLAGELPAGVGRAAFLRDLYAYTRTEFLPPPARVIRPDTQASADKTNLESGADTLPDICARRGQKWRDQRRKEAQVRAFDKRLEETFGVSMAPRSAAGGGAPTTPAATTTSSDEEDERGEEE